MVEQLLSIHFLIPYVVLIAAFFALIKGADIFVDGAASVAKKLGVSPAIIGLTIVAMGTSAPEAAVSVSASVSGANEIALGNVIGSNLFNLLVVLGFCMLITKVPTTKEILFRDYPWNLLATVAVVIMVAFFGLSNGPAIGRVEGIVLLVLFVSYMAYVIYKTIKNRIPADESEIANVSLFKSIVFLLVGIVLIVVGGDLVVDSASKIASDLGMSEMLIGLTIVACGTSLPELVTSIVAAKKGECDMAIGNVVGSNMFNLLFILGMAATINPVEVSLASGVLIDAILLLGFTVMMYLFSIHGTKLQKGKGAVSVTLYVVYLAYIIMRAYGII
ncbi:MAG: calcium/sodium antiporter [Ruminococcaceae bacterium]|nr:calcium/sodium antiporter [Oscillospiraceae bacterium]